MLAPGKKLDVDLFVHLPLNDSLLHFRRKGETLSGEDCVSLQKIPEGNLLIPKSQLGAKMGEAAQCLAVEIKKVGDVNSPAVKGAAASVLNQISASSPLGGDPSGQLARKLLEEAPTLVGEVVSQFRKSPSVDLYDQMVRSFKPAQDSLTAHHRQVGALAVLVGLAVGGGSIDDLADLAAAGLVHDLGLSGLPKEVALWHIQGGDALDPAHAAAYGKHVEQTLTLLTTNRVNLTPGALRIVQHHHENWDGSGFSRLSGDKIYRPAKALRIADELVSFISHPDRHAGFREGVVALSTKRGKSGHPIFDPQMMEILVANSKATS
jgi:HD-GYP domain-containing protein (c-di-GMP phosphodiesterase class II)